MGWVWAPSSFSRDPVNEGGGGEGFCLGVYPILRPLRRKTVRVRRLPRLHLEMGLREVVPRLLPVPNQLPKPSPGRPMRLQGGLGERADWRDIAACRIRLGADRAEDPLSGRHPAPRSAPSAPPGPTALSGSVALPCASRLLR